MGAIKEVVNMNTEITTEDIERQYLSDEAAAEFDRIVGRHEKRLRRKRLSLLAGGIAAAMIISLMVTRPWVSNNKRQINPMVIANGIERLMDLSPEEIVSVQAIPKGNQVFLTASMKDGSKCSFIMTTDKDDLSIHLIANSL